MTNGEIIFMIMKNGKLQKVSFAEYLESKDQKVKGNRK